MQPVITTWEEPTGGFFELILLYIVVLVSVVQQRELATHLDPSQSGQCRALSRVPCAAQEVSISYLFHAQYRQCTCWEAATDTGADWLLPALASKVSFDPSINPHLFIESHLSAWL